MIVGNGSVGEIANCVGSAACPDVSSGSGGSTVEQQDVHQQEVTISGGNTIHHYFFAPYDLNILAIKLFAYTATTTVGSYLFAATGNGNNLLSSSTFDVGTLVSQTLTGMTLSATSSDLVISSGGVFDLSFTSDNADLTGAGLYVQIFYEKSTDSVILQNVHQQEVTISGGNTIHHYFFAPYDLTLLSVKAYSYTAPTTSGTYTFAATGAGNNLLSASTYNLESLVSQTLTPITLTATGANLNMSSGDIFDFTFASDNIDLAGAGLYLQIFYINRGV